MIPPSRILVIDWSGAKGELRKHKGIAVADWRQGEPIAISIGHARAKLCDWLIEQATITPHMVVGLDFAFSFPHWFVRRLGISVNAAWQAAERNGEGWLTQVEHPFWNRKRPAADVERPPLRQTDRAGSTGTPKSIFQLVGNGQVGAGSVRGMRYLAALQQAGFAIWPFQASRLPTVIEVYPTACYAGGIRTGAKEMAADVSAAGLEIAPSSLAVLCESQDARDAVCALVRMIEHRDCFARLAAAPDEITLLEGRIWRPGECCAPDSK